MLYRIIVLLMLCSISTAKNVSEKPQASCDNFKEAYENILSQKAQEKYKKLVEIYSSDKVLKPAEIEALREFERSIDRAKNISTTLKKDRRTFLYEEDHPPSIAIARHRLTHIQFTDNAGNPYPIEDYNISDAEAFVVYQRGGNTAVLPKSQTARSTSTKKPSEEALPEIDNNSARTSVSLRNSLTIDGSSDYAEGDLIVYLENRDQPIHLFLYASITGYDYQVNIAVDGLTQQSLSTMDTSGSNYPRPSDAMMQFLNGTPPKGAEAMHISLNDTLIWRYEDYFYLRTKSELQSPAYISRVSTSTGYTVFKIATGNHVLNIINHGKLISAYISEISPCK